MVSMSAKMDAGGAMQRMRDGVSYLSSRVGKDLPDAIRKNPATTAIAIALVLSLLVVLVLWVNTDKDDGNWRPLYGRQELYDVAAVIEALDVSRVEYRLHPTSGQVMVAAEQLNQARMQLATAGIKPSSSAGMELLTSGGTLGRSQFVERVQFQKGLEGELEKTIASLRPVRSARVHIAVPERTAFLRDQVEPSASVYLDLYPGIKMEGRQVQGIINLLSGSFPDLSTDRIYVMDQNSNPLSADEKPESDTARFMKYRHDIERQYVQRLTELLQPLVGAQNLRVAVNADIDFSFIENSREGFEPEGVLRSESYSENVLTPGASGVPGAASNVENLGENADDDSAGESTVNSIRNYEMGRTLSYQRQDAFRVARINASVILNSRIEGVDTDVTLSAVQELVQSAVGIDQTRGDQVAVQALPFFDESMSADRQGLSGLGDVSEEGGVMPMLLSILMLGILAMAGFAVYFVVRQKKARQEQEALEAELALLDAEAGNKEAEEEDAFSKVDAASSDRIRDLAVSSPDQIASILERWIKEAD